MDHNARAEEYKRHVEFLDNLHKEKLAALHTLYPEFQPTAGTEGLRGETIRMVRQALEAYSVTPFTFRKLRALVCSVNPGFVDSPKNISRLSNSLFRLVKSGELERVEGSSPRAYKKVTR